MIPLLIGLSGYADSGKDETANVLVERHGFVRCSVGDVVDEILMDIDPGVTAPDYAVGCVTTEAASFWREEKGYEWMKANTDYRDLMQRAGVAMRTHLFEDVLIDAALRNRAPRTVMSSTRFPNEAHAIIGAGGFVGRIRRSPNEPQSQHISEIAMDGWNYDFVIDNDGTLDELAVQVDKVIEELEAISPKGPVHSDGWS